ncbi:MAG: 4-hydroxy-3-methylbut-2-en-1-yl diphosphate synthase [bacterium TMED198]|nr:MAG: 4-hydroxy-3-methylbut-2-en-1-yl diphosphate synthase [bacterium TMED198]
MEKHKYSPDLVNYSRLPTVEVSVGDIPLGASNPIRIQSMTTTNTMDTDSTVEQSIRMIDAGCEYVRITAPSIREAKNLYNIKKKLLSLGYRAPLVADIHFTPNAAIEAAEIVEKVRINPGNYADRKKFEFIEYSDKTYNDELERIYKRFSPLVEVCKKNGTAMRIGTNHGSLSDRILSRYGDTPEGMVMSALEFVDICEDNNFHQIVISMKSSNVRVMIQAYRLLSIYMQSRKYSYPLHLGVTEAGDGHDGRIKSAIGIGSLLEEGIGDTIRVSLTEEPELEIPVARKIVDRIAMIKSQSYNFSHKAFTIDSPFEYKKKETNKFDVIGGDQVPRVIVDSSNINVSLESLSDLGYSYYNKLDKWGISDNACDYIFLGSSPVPKSRPENLKYLQEYSKWIENPSETLAFPVFYFDNLDQDLLVESKLNFIVIHDKDIFDENFSLPINYSCCIILKSDMFSFKYVKQSILKLKALNINFPVIISVGSFKDHISNEYIVNSSIFLGGLLIDGLVEGVFFEGPSYNKLKSINSHAFNILQATRSRFSKTEYISCPSCGRTLFDLQETTSMIRSKTDHLKGVKIGIMGCIVNGPGEMADADYGYVGTGIDQISLYKGQELVKRGVPSKKALDELIVLIKENGDWVEPS